MTGNNRIVTPGELQLQVRHVPTPAFNHASVVGKTPGGLEVMTFGGASRQEILVGLLLAGAATGGPITDAMLKNAFEASAKIMQTVEC